MTPASLDTQAWMLCLAAILLVPLAIAGVALVNAGLGRSHSASHSMLTALCVLSVAAGVTMVCGFAFASYAGLPAHVIMLGGKPWNWLGAGPWFLPDLMPGAAENGTLTAAPLGALLQMLAVGLAALVPLSAGADRWKLGASCASAAVLAGVVYPLFAHWSWGGGWLAQLGIHYGLGRGFIDVGGAGAIHAVAGLTALSITWILGPRRAKYPSDGAVAAIPAHNIVLVLLGCLLLLPGWFGLNAAGAMLFNGSGIDRLPLIAVNTLLSAAGSAMTALVFTRVRFHRPDSSLTANGWVAGLVAGSAGCAFLSPAVAVLVGVGAGLLLIFTVELFETRLGTDDPAGAVSVHAVAGIWGLLSLGVFGRIPPSVPLSGVGSVPGGQMLAQVVGAATLLGFVLPASYFLNLLVNAVYRYRADEDGERLGMDLHELGAGAYPEFMVHGDEFSQR